ncbi:Woronin body protein HexA, putative [Trichophyton benhamiae CBS 112371]|uniref:Woronin body protein HexA, putative n=1 Tax=Arthroderma benhamiae (strain ATCC MYA-4681 / CBS 112371) TaxID=663331 RepID=D4ARR7_ARTBC|nr:Woronin body protein HexA, putative [Trichophyton benhamiae CBS 112371]EFE33981.1 Woronin body protein HexA, putative [Trichophyton benhamiae CBS 112371]
MLQQWSRVEADGWGRQHATPELELELERARAGEAGSESLHELAVWWQPTTKVHDVFSIGPFVFTTNCPHRLSHFVYPSFHHLSLTHSLSLARPPLVLLFCRRPNKKSKTSQPPTFSSFFFFFFFLFLFLFLSSIASLDFTPSIPSQLTFFHLPEQDRRQSIFVLITLCAPSSPLHSRKDAPQAANLDFDARVPIPFSVFPSSYRSDAAAAVSESTQERVEGEVKFSGASRVGREDTRYEGPLPAPRTSTQQATASFDQRFDNEEFRPVTDYRQTTVVAHEEHPRHSHQQEHIPEVQLSRERYYETRDRRETELDTQLDITERQYRARTDPRYQAQHESEPRQVRDVDVGYSSSRTFSSVERPSEKVREVDVAYSRAYETVDNARPPVEVRDIDYQEQTKKSDTLNLISDHRVVQEQDPKAKMGYYDDEGQYHSFRRGVERAAERVLHPFHHRHHHHHHQTHEDGIISDERRADQVVPRENVRVVQPRGGHPPDTITIPCHFIRIGDLLILQGRPCQVIRVSVSQQTGQHRYLGVDLFTRQLHEESSFISNPSPSVVVQSMLGPVYKTYRVLDMRDDNRIVAMTETGDVKQGLRVVDQGNLFNRIADAFAEGRGSVRALVINDGGRELVVDYKVIHGSRL